LLSVIVQWFTSSTTLAISPWIRSAPQEWIRGGHRADEGAGFTFSEEKPAKPGKCPACRGTRLYEPQISIE
jgi:hypothetical protein